MEVWRKRSSWRAAFKMTSCRRCWPPTWPRRWGPNKEWLGRTKAPDLVHICECARVSVIFAGASTCILVHLTPKSWGRRGWLLGGYFLFHCSVRVTDRTLLCEYKLHPHLYPSQLIDQVCWSINWSCNNYHPLSSLYCIAGEPARLVPGQHCWQCTFSRNIVDNVRKKYSPQYCRRRTFYQDCVFEEYMCIFSLYVMIYDGIYHKISMYFLITCWMLQVLKSPWSMDHLINLLINNLSWSGLIDQRSSQVFAPKIPSSSSGDSVAQLKTETLDTFANNSQDSTLNEIAVVNFYSRFHPIINICW